MKHNSLCDQLGKLDVILSDKTGTLTKNTMNLKKVTFIFLYCQIFMNKNTYNQCDISGDLKVAETLNEILMSFVLCNNLRKKETEGGDFLYEGSSPDEIALGDFAREMHFVIDSRNEKQFVVSNYKSKPYKFVDFQRSCLNLKSSRFSPSKVRKKEWA